MKFSRQGSPAVIHDNMFLPKDVRLKAISNSRVAVRPPHAFQERAASSMVGQLRFLLLHLQEFIVTTQQAALFYSAATLQPRLKDLVLKEFMEPCTAVTMMGTQAAMAAAQALQLNSYAKTPDKCDHTTGAGSRTLRGRGTARSHLRYMRNEMGPHGQGRGSGGNAKSRAKRKDSAGIDGR